MDGPINKGGMLLSAVEAYGRARSGGWHGGRDAGGGVAPVPSVPSTLPRPADSPETCMTGSVELDRKRGSSMEGPGDAAGARDKSEVEYDRLASRLAAARGAG